MKLNNTERSIAINAFNAKRVVYINCDCYVTTTKNEYTVLTVSSSRYKDEDAFIEFIEKQCDYIEDECDKASERYYDEY